MGNPTKQLIVFLLVCTLVALSYAYVVEAQSTVVRAEASLSQPKIGDTLKVNLKVSDVQNLYGLDVTLNWNASVLKLINVTPTLGVESHSDGVLHESSSYPIDIADNTASEGTYHLLATSTGASTQAFSGSGTIATLTFNVTSAGQSGLALEDVELSVVNGANTDLVSPQTQVTNVNVSVPEFPTLIVLAFITVAVVVVAVSTKVLKSRFSNPLKNPTVI